jgi:hypothetical protein
VVDLVITVAPGHDIHAVAAQLSQAGLQVQDKLDAIGSITGSAQSGDIARLKSVPGVADISESTPIQLNPPGTPR